MYSPESVNLYASKGDFDNREIILLSRPYSLFRHLLCCTKVGTQFICLVFRNQEGKGTRQRSL